MDETEEQIPYTHEFVVDAAYQRTLIRAIFGSTFRPVFWIAICLVAVSSGLLAISGNTTLVTFFVAWVLTMAILFGVRYWRTRMTLLRAFPVGTVMRSGFGAEQFVMSNGNDTSRLAYSGFDRAERRGDLVWVRRFHMPRRVVYAGALFSDAELARLRAPDPPSSADSPRPRPDTPA